MFEIIRYAPSYQDELMRLIQAEGEDWAIYWKEPNAARYKASFAQSITYLALADGKVCGYSRSIRDALFIYVCDLLVHKAYRGHRLGESLMRCIKRDYPEYPVYIMSGSDGYYETLGCRKEGSIYLLNS